MPSTILRSPNLADGDAPLVVRIFFTRPTAFKNGGLARAASSVQSAGRGGDDILLHINPEEYDFLKSQWGEPSVNPHTGLPEYGLFSKIKKALKFEGFNVKKIVKGVIKDPTRLIFGIDPLGTKIGNTVMNDNKKALVNQLGGATEDTYREAEARGMDTGLARNLHQVAGLVAGFYGGNALGNLASTGLSNIAAANTLAPVTTTAQYTNGMINPVVTTAGQTSTNAVANMANAGASALSNLGPKAANYAKNPENWGTIAKAAGALGALGGGGAEEAAPPDAPSSPGLKYLPFNREQSGQDFNWYTYGEGPEQKFYEGNVLPEFVPEAPEEPKPPGARHGGLFHSGGGAGATGTWEGEERYVRGPGTGRSDSIEARLSDGEYVFTAEDVALLGDGSSEAGAKRLDEWRTNLRKHKGGALARGKISPDAKAPMAYLKGVS
jgi:hypothetical protein